jgi:hypothetical protein
MSSVCRDIQLDPEPRAWRYQKPQSPFPVPSLVAVRQPPYAGILLFAICHVRPLIGPIVWALLRPSRHRVIDWANLQTRFEILGARSQSSAKLPAADTLTLCSSRLRETEYCSRPKSRREEELPPVGKSHRPGRTSEQIDRTKIRPTKHIQEAPLLQD